MGFWKDLRAVLAHPNIVRELELERMARQQLSQTLMATEDRLEVRRRTWISWKES